MEILPDMKQKELWHGRKPSKITQNSKRIIDLSEEYVAEQDLVGRILDLQSTEAIKLGKNQIVFRHAPNPHLFKKACTTLLITPSRPTKQYAITEHYNPEKLIPEAFAKNTEVHRGYSWRGYRDRGDRIVGLLYAIQGAELVSHFGGKINARVYWDKVHAEVPSRSGENKSYTFPIAGLPFERLGPEAYAEWLELRSKSMSALEEWYSNGTNAGRRIWDDYLMTPQTIAVYHLLSVHLQDKPDRLAFNPFILPTEKTIDFSNNLRNRVFRHYRQKSNNMKKENIGSAESEILLWRLTLDKGFNATWLADKHYELLGEPQQNYLVKKNV
jgi:hypothetical protein